MQSQAQWVIFIQELLHLSHHTKMKPTIDQHYSKKTTQDSHRLLWIINQGHHTIMIFRQLAREVIITDKEVLSEKRMVDTE
jgi:hypothetical protein